MSVGDCGSLGGPVNLCSSSPNFRPVCPYSSSPSHSPSPPSHSTAIPFPVCSSSLHTSSLPCTSSPPHASFPVVPSVRSHSHSPDSTSLNRVEVGVMGVAVGGVGVMGGVGIGASNLRLPHCLPLVEEAGDALQECTGGLKGEGLGALFL